jgi:hypothetical protein
VSNSGDRSHAVALLIGVHDVLTDSRPEVHDQKVHL